MGSEVVIIPLFSFIVAGVIAWAIANLSRLRMQERELLSRERMMAMEKGINLPLLESPRYRWSGSPLKSGLILVGVGLGLTILMLLNGRNNGIGVGAMVMLAGAGNLLYWYMAGKREWEARMSSEQNISNAYVAYLNAMANKSHTS
jgi:hypothetical protein